MSSNDDMRPPALCERRENQIGCVETSALVEPASNGRDTRRPAPCERTAPDELECLSQFQSANVALSPAA